MRNKKKGSGAFTLAEIMIVIVLIAILAGFLLPAVLNSQRAARNAACRSEIHSLGMAIDAFYNDWGFYPRTDRAFDPATGKFDGDPYGDYGYAEALVQCLGNRFVKGAGDGTPAAGLSFRNLAAGTFNVYVLGNAPVNAGPYFEIGAGDVVDLDHDGFPELADPWGNPYIYIPNGDYLATGVNGSIYNAGALIMIDSDGDGIIDLPDLNADPLAQGYFHQQRFSFQLISRGEDGWTPGIDHRPNADGLPQGYADVSITGNPYGDPPSATNFNPALIGTDTDPTNPYVFAPWLHTDETADDINNWSQ